VKIVLRSPSLFFAVLGILCGLKLAKVKRSAEPSERVRELADRRDRGDRGSIFVHEHADIPDQQS
jgi:hypothetical protein